MLQAQDQGLSESYQSPLVRNLTAKAIEIYTILLEVVYQVCDRRGYRGFCRTQEKSNSKDLGHWDHVTA